MRKHLLYLTNNALIARMWQSGRLSDAVSFSNDESGWLAFSTYLAPFKHVPVALLMELIEEDFQRDTIPHIIGKARKNLIARRLSQLYRDTPFRHASRQGREKTGRKDDIMLFNAQTNAALIKPWMQAIQEQQIPVNGIFSSALLSALLYKKLDLGADPLLLITHQSAGLRQNFFHSGHLRFSRLIQLASDQPDAIAELANQEIIKTGQFLTNARLLNRGESLKVVALDNPETLHSMQSRNTDSGSVSYHYLSLAQSAQKLRIKQIPDNGVADELLLALLASSPPASHYALSEQSQTYMLWQVRIILYVLSAVTMAACLFLSAANALETIDSAQQLKQTQQNSLNNQRRYQAIVDSMPKTQAAPHDMKSAVDVHDLLVANNANPTTILNIIGTALARFPQLRLDELAWEVGDKGAIDPAVPVIQGPPQPVTTVDAALLGLPVKATETVTIRGVVVPFEHDYRSALDSVNQLALEMRKNPNVQVAALHLPLDIRPNVTISGEAGREDTSVTPGFELRITWKSGADVSSANAANPVANAGGKNGN